VLGHQSAAALAAATAVIRAAAVVLAAVAGVGEDEACGVMDRVDLATMIILATNHSRISNI